MKLHARPDANPAFPANLSEPGQLRSCNPFLSGRIARALLVFAKGRRLVGNEDPVGQITAVLALALAGVWAGTQWTVAALGYQVALGAPLFAIGETPAYPSYAIFWWWCTATEPWTIRS